MSSRPSYHQQEALADFLIENPGIARGLLRTVHAKQETKRKWDAIAISLNALGGAQKDGKGWAKYWTDKKCALKKLCAQQAQSMRRTGGGTGDNLPGLNPLDQRFVAVMGGPQFATGDRHLAVNPFPFTSQNNPDVPVVGSPQFATGDGRRDFNSFPVTSQNVPDVPMQNIDMVGEVVEHALELTASTENVETVRDTAPAPTIQPSRRRPHTSRARGSVLDRHQQMFANIEQKRVEAEIAMTASFSNLVEQLSSFQRSMDAMAAATTESGVNIASALNNVANALNNIANSLQDRRSN